MAVASQRDYCFQSLHCGPSEGEWSLSFKWQGRGEEKNKGIRFLHQMSEAGFVL